MNALLPPPVLLHPTLGELVRRFGNMPAQRIRFERIPATEFDVEELDSDEGRLYELVDSVLVEKVMALLESMIAVILSAEIFRFIKGKSLGIVTGADGMMRLAPGLIRIPDVAFIRKAQFPGGRVGTDPIPDIHPDLAVEVLSPSNTVEELDEKLIDYFRSGTELVWYVEPDSRSVLVFTDPDRANAVRLSVADTLDGGTVLPGFTLAVAALFAELDAI